MDSIKLIFVIANITICMVNADTITHTSVLAFERAYNELTVPVNRDYQKSTKGIRYEYQDHLFSAAVSIYNNEKLEKPIKWCISYKQTLDYDRRDMDSQDKTNDENECRKTMTEAGYLGTAEQALHHSFYRLENTGAKSPMEFCEKYEPPARSLEQYEPSEFSLEQYEPFVRDTSRQYIQKDAHQSKPFTIDLNAQASVSTFSEQPGEYYSFYHNQASTSHLDKSRNLGFDLNELPPAECNENLEDEENEDV